MTTHEESRSDHKESGRSSEELQSRIDELTVRNRQLEERLQQLEQTTRKSAEDSFRMNEAESRLRMFLDSSPVMMGMVEVSSDGNDILHILDNRASEAFFGLREGETVGKWQSADFSSDPATIETWVANFQRAQHSSEPANFLFGYDQPGECRDAPASKCWLNVTVNHIGEGHQGRQRFCYVAIDDTKRVTAEEDLLQSHETFRELVRDAPFGVYLVDNQLKVSVVSRVADRAFESAQPVIGRDLHEVMRILWPREFADFVLEKFHHVLETGESFETTETTEARRDIDALQSYHWMLRRVRLPDGTLGVVCYYYELTSLKRAELAVRRSESRLRLAIDLAAIGVITIDYDSETAWLDETSAELFQLPTGQPVDRGQVHERIHPEDRGWTEEMIREGCSDPEIGTISMHHRLLMPDGSIRWLEVCKRVYFAEHARPGEGPTHSVVAVVDVTAQKEHEQELEKARLQAEAANRARGEFLANMSHEIRTPMTAILGYADMLGENILDEKNRQFVETIRRNGRFLLDIINDILDLSKIDAGKIELDRERIPPENIVADVVSLMNVRAEEKQIDLVAQFEGEVPELIETDGKRLRQVLLNLTSNAIKFTETGEVRVVCRFDQETGCIEFDVIDTGIGIDVADLESLFEPFTQLDASHTRSFGGTGLGLAISRRLAEMLGGEIEAESRIGKGSRFTISLDAGAVDGVPLVRPSLITSSPPNEIQNVRLSGRFLVVDDRREIRFLAQTLIERAGGSVQLATDGGQGVEAVAESYGHGEPFDAVLMDMQMPVMDGYTATAEIRRRGIEVPIVALTANAMSEDREKCLQAGCTDFLSKPLDKSKLLSTLSRLERL